MVLLSRRQGVLGSGSSATRCGPSGAAPDSYCLPNRQFLAMQLLGATRTMERRRGLSHTSKESSHRPLGAWTNDGIFITLWKLQYWQHGHGSTSAVAAASMRKIMR